MTQAQSALTFIKAASTGENSLPERKAAATLVASAAAAAATPAAAASEKSASAFMQELLGRNKAAE